MLETVYFTDLDRTLFDTNSYYSVMRSAICATEGVDCEAYERDFLEYLTNSTKPGSGFDYLEAIQGIPKARLYDQLREHLGARSFLFPDSPAFLERHSNSKEQVVILTYGEEEFQRFKILREPEIAHLPFVIVQENKSKWFARQLAGNTYEIKLGDLQIHAKRAVFIDDSPEHFAKQPLHSGLEQVRIMRPGQPSTLEAIDFEIKTIQSLDEI